MTEARQRNAALYRDLFDEAGLTVTLDEFSGGSPGVVLPFEASHVRHIYNQFVIRSHRRDDLMKHSKERKIGAEFYQRECRSALVSYAKPVSDR